VNCFTLQRNSGYLCRTRSKKPINWSIYRTTIYYAKYWPVCE